MCTQRYNLHISSLFIQIFLRQREAVQQQQGILKNSNKTLEAVSEAKGRIGRRQKAELAGDKRE